MQPIAQIQIALLPSGQVQTRFQAPPGMARVIANGLLETAKQELQAKFAEAEKGDAVAVAPPNFLAAVNGKAG